MNPAISAIKLIINYINKQRERRRKIQKAIINKRRLLRMCLFTRTNLWLPAQQIPLDLLYEGIRVRRSVWSLKRSEDFWKNIILKDYNDAQWLESFRMKKASFMDLCNLLKEELAPKPNFLNPREPLSVEKQVAVASVALYKLASCAEYRVVGNVFGIHKSTVKKALYKVVNAIINKLTTEFIFMPEINEAHYIANCFQKKSQVPQILGAIDGTHIPITAPEQGFRDFINRKGWASYNVQAIVDQNGRFRNITAKHPGCNHDAAVLRDSEVFKNAANIIPQETQNINGLDVPFFIIGDPAYPLLPWLMKGFPGAVSAEEESFNVYLNTARVVVEMAFGRLKARWRILLKRIECHYSFAPKIVLACAILHNFVEQKNEIFIQNWLDEVNNAEKIFPQPQTLVNQERNSVSAYAIRNHLKGYLANNFPLRKKFY